jgi:hypothetical protein
MPKTSPPMVVKSITNPLRFDSRKYWFLPHVLTKTLSGYCLAKWVELLPVLVQTGKQTENSSEGMLSRVPFPLNQIPEFCVCQVVRHQKWFSNWLAHWNFGHGLSDPSDLHAHSCFESGIWFNSTYFTEYVLSYIEGLPTLQTARQRKKKFVFHIANWPMHSKRKSAVPASHRNNTANFSPDLALPDFHLFWYLTLKIVRFDFESPSNWSSGFSWLLRPLRSTLLVRSVRAGWEEHKIASTAKNHISRHSTISRFAILKICAHAWDANDLLDTLYSWR